MTGKIPWQLVFHPIDPHWCPPTTSGLTEGMHALQLIGEPVAGDPQRRFLIGPAFLQYISFMGCAPAVEFTPHADVEFIHWYLSPCLLTPRWIIDVQHALPRCAQCHRRISNWREQVDMTLLEVATTATTVICPHCQHSNPLAHLDWRHGAGLARQFVSVVNIYPKEALPTDALLTAWQQYTGTAWTYFYCQCEPIID